MAAFDPVRNSPSPGPRIAPWVVRLASLAIAVHLAAVVIAPLAVPPRSPLSLALRDPLAWYIEGACLDNGYHFFAPEPGPSHLVVYSLELADGTRREGVFPNRDEHRPRLFYHRHFMLSEKLPPPDEGSSAKLHEAIVRSYASHLLEAHPDAIAVELTYRQHLIADPVRVQEGQKLDDPSLYREQKLGRFARWPERSS